MSRDNPRHRSVGFLSGKIELGYYENMALPNLKKIILKKTQGQKAFSVE
jgi:hypothetical protein